MNNRERIINCALNKPIDRSPYFFYFGPWGETMQRWEKENGVSGFFAWRFGFDFDAGIRQVPNVSNLYHPAYERKIIERKGNIIIHQDGLGQIIENIEGKSGIPKIIKSPVESWEDWENIKKTRLDPDDPARFPKNWDEIVKQLNEGDEAVQIGAFPCGLYGTLRDLMGVEGSLMGFYDHPDLVKDIMDYLTDFWLHLYEKICRDVKVDIFHIWEDMSGRQGSLISPALIREYMLPNYKKIKAFADKHDIPVIQVDTDGNCEELIPLFAEGGVNSMLPFEVAAGCDIVELRDKYPYMSMMGGIDKREIGKGKEAIDKELERIRPLINKTGYFPALDHLIPPEVSYDDYCYFVNRLKSMIFED